MHIELLVVSFGDVSRLCKVNRIGAVCCLARAVTLAICSHRNIRTSRSSLTVQNTYTVSATLLVLFVILDLTLPRKFNNLVR